MEPTSQTSQIPPPNARWGLSKKKLLTAGISLLVIVLLLAVAALFYVRSGRLDRYIVSQLQDALLEYGLKADVGQLEISWGIRTANIGNVKLYNQQTGQLIATIDRAQLVVEIRQPYALRLRREINFKQFNLTNLQVYVAVDEHGLSNLRGLRQAQARAPSRITFDLSSLVGSLAGGALHFDDKANNIKADLEGLRLNTQPLPGSSLVTVQFGADSGRINYRGDETTLDNLELMGRIGLSGAELDHLTLRSTLAQATLSGRLEDWNALRYDLGLQAYVTLAEAGKIFAPDTGLDGTAEFNGRITGEGARYNINGSLTSDELATSNARARGVRVDNINVQPDGERINFTGQFTVSQTQAEGVTVNGLRTNDFKIAYSNEETNFNGSLLAAEITAADAHGQGIRLDGINGKYDGNQITFAGEGARVDRLNVQGNQITGIAAKEIKGVTGDSRTQANLQQITAEQVAIPNGQVTGAILQDVDVKLDDGRYQIGGGLTIKSGVIRDARLGLTRGQLLASNGTVALNRFNAALLGGTASGDVSVRIARGGEASRLNATFKGLRTREILMPLGVKAAPLVGSVDGRANLTWPGINVQALTGTLNARLNAETTQTANAIPVTGDVAVTAQAGVFTIQQLALMTDASQLNASGKLSPNGDSDLNFSLTSTNAEQIQTIANSTEMVSKALGGYQPHLAGNFSFQGRLTGSITNPAIEGDINAGGVGLRDQALGSLSGHVIFSPTEVAFQNGTLSLANGGNAKFTYEAPRATFATSGRLDATLERVDIRTLIAAAGLQNQQNIVSGELSGEAHLTGLPGSPTGTTVFNLINGTVAGQPAQTATVSIVFDGQTARIDRAELRLPQGQVLASGSLDLQNNNFQIQGNAENVNLNQIAYTLGAAVPVTGTANGTFQVSGNTKDLDELNVELSAQGQNLAINGRPAGQLSLTARTNPNGRVDIDLTTGIAGAPQTVRASIELRRPGRPINVQSDFNNFDLSPFLAIYSPGIASSVTAVINGSLRATGPLANDNGQMTLNNLRGNLLLNTISLQVRGRQVNIQTPLTVALNGPQVTLEQTRITTQGTDIRLGGTLALSEGAPLNFSIVGSADLNSLGQISRNYSTGGAVAIDARLGGTLSDPRLSGEIRMTDLSFSGLDLPVAIEEGNGRIILAGDTLRLESFAARANEGTVNADGTLVLAGFNPRDWRLDINANNVGFFYMGAQATVNGKLNLTGTPERQLLAGTLTIPEGEYSENFNLDTLAATGVTGGLGFGGAGGGTGIPGVPPISLNIDIDAPGTFLIRNQQVNTTASAALILGGTATDPGITGRVTVEGGTIKFRSERYEITTGVIDFPGGGTTPNINFLAEGDISGYHVYVGFVGPINEMDVTLRADPDLPRADVLSLVATGSTESSALGSEDLVRSGIGTAASLLSGQFISQPVQSLLGVSRFQLDPVLRPNTNPAARLTIGRQLARGLSFTYSTNLASEQDQSAIAEYTLTNRFSGIASYTQGGTSRNGARTDSNFTIEVRGRKRFALGYGQVASSGDTTVTPATVVPPRPERKPLPPADVTLNAPTEVKFSDKELRELLPVEREGFSRTLALLGERNLINHLQERGYFFASVRFRCEPVGCSGSSINLFYDVSPGERFTLRDIRIEGTDQIEGAADLNEGLQSRSASVFGSVPFLKRLPLIGGLARGITSDDRIRRDREMIRRRLADLGFRSASVESRIDHGQRNENLALVFSVAPGARSTVSEMRFSGNSVLSAAELQKTASIKVDEPFSPSRARDTIQQIKRAYADLGYLEATAQYNVIDSAPDRVRLNYDITEGQRALVASVTVTGQTKTREDSIRRFFDFKPGEVLTPAKINRTRRELFATGAFSEVNIRPESIAGGDPGNRQVTVQVTESRPLLFVYGLGYSTDAGPQGLIQLTHTNLFGRVNSTSLRMRVSRREQLAQWDYTDLRPFGTRWATTVSAFYSRNSNLRTFVERRLVEGANEPDDSAPGFGINRVTALIQTERKFTDNTAIRFRYNFENAKLFNIQSIPVEEIGRNDRAIRLGMFSAGFTRDRRDSALNPTNGELISVEHSLAARVFGGNESFNRFFANYQHYRTLSRSTPLLRDSTFAFAGRLGLAAPFQIRNRTGDNVVTEADSLLPISERFFAGGATTLRGFRFEQAGPQGILEPRNEQELPTLVPLGGDAMVVMNFELRYPLTRQLRLVPFYDVGNVFRRVKNINFGAMTNTIGLGLRFNTPIGPVGIDYGYLLDPPAFTSRTGVVLRQPRSVFHIRFGQTF